MQVPFNLLTTVGKEKDYLNDLLENHSKFSGAGAFSQQCEEILRQKTGVDFVRMTASCTAALEMAAILTKIGPGDEFIVPSYTFTSSVNAFLLRGAKPVFVDVIPQTLNIDLDDVERKITDKTKLIVPIHYAGMSCDMDRLLDMASSHNIFVVEDAAQAIGARYKDRALGSLGDIAAMSFHETKNIGAGEAGAIFINNSELCERSDIVIEKGTNRSKFMLGLTDKYTWVDIGSSYRPSEFQMAYLKAQLEQEEKVTARRLEIWEQYFRAFKDDAFFSLAEVPEFNQHNAHIFFMLLPDKEKRDDLIKFLRQKQIVSTFHYIPLHNAPMGEKIGDQTQLPRTDKLASQIIRLPLFYSLSDSQVSYVIEAIRKWRAHV